MRHLIYKHSYPLLMAAILIAVIVNGQNGRTENWITKDSYNDSLPARDTPKVEARKIPVYIIIIPQSEYFKMADTSNMIMFDYGIELTGSAIRSGQSAMARQWNRLIDTYSKTDSVKIQGGRK